MLFQWRKLVLYAAVGVTVLALAFPPFSINEGPDEYGFVLSGPPTVRQAVAAMSALGGDQGSAIAGQVMHYAIDLPRLALELVIVWGVAFALLRTVLRLPPVTPRAGDAR